MKNAVLDKGTVAYDETFLKFKVGDGVTPWNDLPYTAGSGTGTGTGSSDPGPQGPPGVVAATAPLAYDSVAKTLSLPDGSVSEVKLSFDVVTQAELTTALATKQDSATAATDAELSLKTATVWVPDTDYQANQWIITPGGYLAQAKINFTSGATYSPSNWNEYIPGAEMGYSENISAVPYVLTTASVGLVGVSIVAPVSPRPMYIHMGAWADVTTTATAATTGNTGVNIVDETAAIIGGDLFPFEGADSQGYCQMKTMVRIAPNTPSHTYSLVASRSGNANFRASIMHGAIGPAFRTFLALIAA
jgi:hypothetical protein